MAKKFRVWARCIDYVYIDVEAEDKYQAKEIAEEIDGGDFHNNACDVGWEFDDVDELDDDVEVDYTYEDVFGEDKDCEED